MSILSVLFFIPFCRFHWNNRFGGVSFHRESRNVELDIEFEFEFEFKFELDFELDFKLDFELDFKLKKNTNMKK